MKEKENSEFKPVKLRLKIDLVSYPARAEGLVNMDILSFQTLNVDKFCIFLSSMALGRSSRLYPVSKTDGCMSLLVG